MFCHEKGPKHQPKYVYGGGSLFEAVHSVNNVTMAAIKMGDKPVTDRHGLALVTVNVYTLYASLCGCLLGCCASHKVHCVYMGAEAFHCLLTYNYRHDTGNIQADRCFHQERFVASDSILSQVRLLLH